MNPFRRRRTDRALIAKLAAENTAQRRIITELERQLHQAHRESAGNTVRLPRTRSLQVADDSPASL